MNWEKIADIGFDIAKVATAGTPVGLAINVLDTVVDKVNTNDGVKDDEVIKVLETLSKSTHNKLNDKFICIAKAYLKCEKKEL